MARTAPTLNRRSRRFLFALGGLVLLALGLRLAVCVELAGLPSVRDPAVTTDMATYRRIALDILAGRIPEHFYYQPLYYAVFLPFVYAATGTGPWGPMLAQCLLGALSVGLAGLTAARLFGRTAGLAAAALLALARFHIFHTPYLLLEVFQGFWLILLLYVAVRAWETDRGWRWGAAALVLSAAVLTRGNAILLLPGLLFLFAWRRRRRPAVRWLVGGVLMVVAVYAPQLPFSLRNLHHYGRWTGPSSAEDAVLALGNTPEAPPGGLEYTACFTDWMRRADLPPDQRVPVSTQILAWAKAEPLAFLELKFRTALLFWHRQEIPNNIVYESDGRYSRVLQTPVLVGFVLIGTLAVAGVLTTWRRRSPKRLALDYTVLVLWGATVAFYMLSRFRIPVVPVLCVAAGGAVRHGVSLWRQARLRTPRARQQVLLGLLSLCVAFVLVYQGFTIYQESLESRVQRLVRPTGVYVETGRGIRLCDHGPLSCGGWVLMPVPAAGLTLAKEFRLPGRAALAGVGRLAGRLLVPLSGSAGARATVVCGVGGSDPQTAAVELERSGALQRVAFPLPPGAVEDGRVLVGVTVRPVSGNVAVAVDRLRNYGRTVRLDAAGRAEPLDAEAAFELEWSLPADSPGGAAAGGQP